MKAATKAVEPDSTSRVSRSDSRDGISSAVLSLYAGLQARFPLREMDSWREMPGQNLMSFHLAEQTRYFHREAACWSALVMSPFGPSWNPAR